MRIRILLPTIAAIVLIVGQTTAHADAKSDYMVKCNPKDAAPMAPYCECYYKTIQNTYGIDDYNSIQAGKPTGKARDPEVSKAYSAGMTSCAKNPKQ